MMATRTFTCSAADARWFVLQLAYPSVYVPRTFVYILSVNHGNVLLQTRLIESGGLKKEWLGKTLKCIDGRCCV